MEFLLDRISGKFGPNNEIRKSLANELIEKKNTKNRCAYQRTGIQLFFYKNGISKNLLKCISFKIYFFDKPKESRPTDVATINSGKLYPESESVSDWTIFNLIPNRLTADETNVGVASGSNTSFIFL